MGVTFQSNSPLCTLRRWSARTHLSTLQNRNMEPSTYKRFEVQFRVPHSAYVSWQRRLDSNQRHGFDERDEPVGVRNAATRFNGKVTLADSHLLLFLVK